MQAIETTDLLYSVLANSEAIMLAGAAVYAEQRPEDSCGVDIVVNCLTYNRWSNPQTAISNVNIHVPDKKVKIDNRQQYRIDRAKLRSLTSTVVEVLKAEANKHPGISFEPTTETLLAENGNTGPQHYVNIRISWLICPE